jgi:hypothetical protein
LPCFTLFPSVGREGAEKAMLDQDVRFQFINQRYPHIGKKLLALWKTEWIGDYFKELIGDTPGSSRSGLPKDILAALEELRAAHPKLRPEQDQIADVDSVEATLAANENFKIVNERFPHIGKKLVGLWSSYAFSLFINELFQDTRGGTRQGFPKEISVALFRLMQDHDRLYPDVVYQAQDIWSLNNKI